MKYKLLGHGANDLFWFILPLVLPYLLVRYSLSYTQAGGILTIYLAVTAAGSFLMGKLSDRVSPRRIMGFGFLVASLGLASAGFAPTLGLFLAIISLTAVGVSTFHPVMYALIDKTYPRRKGQILGLYESVGTASILAMFLINGFLFRWIGIRGVLILTALPALVMGLIYLLSGVIPEENPRKAVPEGAEQPASPASGLPSTDAESRRREILRFLFFLLSVILRVMSVTAVMNFLPTVFVRYFGFREAAASYGSAFFFAGGILGSLTAGKISDRFNSFAILLGGSLLIALTLVVLNLPFYRAVYPALVTVFGFLGSGCTINQNLLMTRLGGRLGKGEVFGILMGVMTITSSVSPALFGMVIDAAGFHRAFLVFTLPVLLSAGILTFLLKADLRRSAVRDPLIPAEGK